MIVKTILSQIKSFLIFYQLVIIKKDFVGENPISDNGLGRFFLLNDVFYFLL